MNFLFYVGIIVPTGITIALFIIFIYCWFLQKARKEVLTKKYDPHGKMRSLGMTRKYPPPPSFCLMEEAHFLKIGEDNIAYDVSRSPSTEQDGRGRPMYHTYHDSGISAGLSPSQENEPRHSLAYRTCADSGISGLVSYPGQGSHLGSRGCCRVAEQQHQRHSQQQQVCGDQIHIHAQHHQQQYHQQTAQHHNLVHSPTHVNQGLRSMDEVDKPQSLLLTHRTSLNLADYPDRTSLSLVDNPDRKIGLSSHEHKSFSQSLLPLQTSPLSYYHDISELPIPPTNDPIFYHASQTTQSSQGYPLHNHLGRRDKVMPVSPNHELPNVGVPLSPVHFLHQPPLFSDINGHKEDLLLLSSPIKPLRHSYRDSGIVDIGQSIPAIIERPDSQASQSSTTDSEDSGFRSSYCAAHSKAVLNKQANPLLKPLRKSRTNRSSSKPPKKAASSADHPPSNYPPPLITLSPKNLEKNVSNSVGTFTSSRTGSHRPHRSFSVPQQQQSTVNSVPQQQQSTVNSVPNERVLTSSPASSSQAGAALTFHDDSPTKFHQLSSPLDIWPTQSSNDQETSLKQCIDLSDISTHMSWKYLQNMPSSKKSCAGLAAEGIMLEPCLPGSKPGSSHQISQEPHLEQYGYSVV